jgi:type I restriction enzyme, S subunit
MLWSKYPRIKRQIEIIELEKKLVKKELEADKLFADQLTQIELLNKAILQETVQGKLVPQNPKDEPASELLKRIKSEKAKSGKKEKPLPPIKPEEIPFEIPENWVWCRLGEITDYGSSPKAEPTDFKKDTWILDLEDIEKTSSNLICKIRFNERNSLSTKSRFKKGDVLYSKLRPYLDKVIVADEDGVCTTEILPLKCYADLNPFYFRYSLKRIDFLKYVNSITKGMKMPRLGTKEGQLALIPLPPLSEQTRIVAEIEKQLAKTKQLKEHIIANQQATEQLLKALLHGAFEVE